MTDGKEWGIWEGKEVEGRLLGLQTLFFYALPEGFGRTDAVNLIYDYSHVFFCSNWLEKNGYLFIEEALEWSEIVTLELTVEQLRQLPLHLLNKCHILLCFFDVPLTLIKHTDDIRLTGASFTTRFTVFGSMMESWPHYYYDDALLFEAPGGMKR